MNTQSKNPDRIISRAQFRELTGISRTTEWRLSQEGKLPAVVEIDGRVLGYLESAYHAWLNQHAAM
ncbi:AlpA family phage regulatory protein [Vibrio mediterranei]|uniref:helix-turn-helix transcriptional regulator n=1 Tax=Vibrio TaxID=662 RepID=UPI001EFEB9E8|nr:MULTISPECIES: AlpA family phage regulatory protein [Vibrio]MCG9626026.1 AlpA family phage regulatory protein [Vibrio mediterranei]MDG3086892.1 AlpA family phage regulatory protein [Vibrio hannami]